MKKTMKRILVILIVCDFLLVLGLCFGCKEKDRADELILPLKESDPIQQTHWGWGKIPTQNLCPHCGELSYDRFCTDCKKERGNIPFIGVYCPKCNPDGKYASVTDDVTKICGDCGSERTWKYVYEDWQTEPNEPNKPEITFELVIEDPNDANMCISIEDFTSDALELGMAGKLIYLKNMPLLTKKELRDFAIVISAATANLSACNEFYEELLRLVPAKLLQDPDKPKPNEPKEGSFLVETDKGTKIYFKD